MLVLSGLEDAEPWKAQDQTPKLHTYDRPNTRAPDVFRLSHRERRPTRLRASRLASSTLQAAECGGASRRRLCMCLPWRCAKTAFAGRSSVAHMYMAEPLPAAYGRDAV